MRVGEYVLLAALLVGNGVFGTPLRLALDWHPSVEFAGILIAIDRGWYDQAGIPLKVTFAQAQTTGSVGRSEADIGLLSGHEVMRLVGDGQKIKSFAAHYQFNPHTVIVNRDVIQQVKDFRGKTFGTFAEHERDVLQVMLKSEGMSLSDIRLKPMQTSDPKKLIDALRRREVDGFIGWEFDWPVVFALYGQQVRQFPSYRHGFHFYGLVYFAQTEFIAAHRPLLRKFLDVTRRGWAEVYKNPTKATAEIMDRWYPAEHFIQGSKSLTLRQQRVELTLSKRFLLEGIGEEEYGMMMRFMWSKSLQVAERFGILPKRKFKPEDFFDLSVLALGDVVSP